MRFIGVLGMLALLGLAWAISYHRRDVRLRVVFWGLGLQFLFAMIILRKDVVSFVGMGLLGALVAVYLLRQDQNVPDRSLTSVALMLAAVSAVATVLGLLGSTAVGVTALVVLVAMLVNSRFRLAPKLQGPLGAFLVAGLVAWLVATGTHGQSIFEGLSDKVAAFLDLSDYGARFLFGNLAGELYVLRVDVEGPLAVAVHGRGDDVGVQALDAVLVVRGVDDVGVGQIQRLPAARPLDAPPLHLGVHDALDQLVHQFAPLGPSFRVDPLEMGNLLLGRSDDERAQKGVRLATLQLAGVVQDVGAETVQGGNLGLLESFQVPPKVSR